MTLTTTDLFGQTVEYPKMDQQTSSNKEETNTEIKDTLTGNLFLQDFVKINSDELKYILQNTKD